MPCYGINELVNSWQREAVFWASLIQIRETNAHLPYPFHFLHHNDVSQPLRVVLFKDELGGQELVYFVHDGLVPLGWKDSSSLLDGLFP